MARIIATGDTPGNRRNAHMRSGAEVLRLLAQRASFEEEELDMLAFLVFTLRGIYETIDESAQAWDERNYWKKSEALRETWRWARTGADDLERVILKEQWNEVPALLLSLVPRFNSVTITSITRDSDWWCGAYRALKRSRARA